MQDEEYPMIEEWSEEDDIVVPDLYGFSEVSLYSDNGVQVLLCEDMSFRIRTNDYSLVWWVHPSNDLEVSKSIFDCQLKTNLPFNLRLFCMIGSCTIPTKIKVMYATAVIVNQQVERLLAGQTISPLPQLGAFT